MAKPAPPVLASNDLISATPGDVALAVVVGYNWTLVESRSGAGLAATPPKGRDGAGTTSETGRFTGRTLRALAELARSTNPYERAIGCAAVNAGVNRFDSREKARNGLEVPAGETGRVVVIGRFPDLARKLPNAIVLERDPGPDDLPADAAPEVIPGCSRLIVTASAWCNGSLAALLRLGKGAEITLVGPGTPLSPVLHRYGVHRLAGFVANNPQALRQIVAEGGAVRHFRRFGRNVLLEA